MSRWTYHSPGIMSRLVKRPTAEGTTKRVPLYYAQVTWKGKRYAEKAGRTMKGANKLLGTLQTQVDDGRYVPPTERRNAASKADRKREQLRFDVAAQRFLDDCADAYSRPDAIRSRVRMLSMAFGSRYLDEILPCDLYVYTKQRTAHEGPFKGLAKRTHRTTGLRPPQAEIGTLSRIYQHAQDCGHKVLNPCVREPNTGSAFKTKATRYVAKRKPVIPTPDALRAIFAADPTWPGGNGAVCHSVKPTHRALWMLCYYTGGRPESDLLRLRHRDVELPEPGKVASLDGSRALGRVHFRDPKTPAGYRSLPLHPEAAEALRAILRPEARPEEYVFQRKDRKGKTQPWTTATYRKAWAATIKAVRVEYPEVAGMILRDMRKTFRTRLTAARVPEPTIQRMMGHALTTTEHYNVPDDQELARAVLDLTLPETGNRLQPGLQTIASHRVHAVGRDSESPQTTAVQWVSRG